jgi:nitrite reductase (NO-forming)
MFGFGAHDAQHDNAEVHVHDGDLPVEYGTLAFAPQVPPPITRKYPVRLVVHLDSTVDVMNVSPRHKFPFWTYNGHTPGPFIRARIGDSLQVRAVCDADAGTSW